MNTLLKPELLRGVRRCGCFRLSEGHKIGKNPTATVNLSVEERGGMKKTIKAWVGIVNNGIHETVEKGSDYRILAVYPNRTVAKLAYEYVERCTITYTTKKKATVNLSVGR